MVTNCTDSFLRSNTAGNGTISNAAGWGTSSDSNTWAQQTAGSPTWSILSNTGKVTGISIDTAAALGSTSYADNEVTGRVQFSSNASGCNNGLLLRFTDSKHMYFVVIVPGTPASITLYKRNSVPADVSLASGTGVNTTTNTWYRIRFQIIGTALKARMWLDGDSEPSSWQVTATDSDFASGQPGFMFSPDASGTTVQADSFNCNNTKPPSGGIIGGPMGIITGTIYS